ncbi:MAG TPA: hypothetical protein VJK66_02480 [Gaiellaceae bacterium]|nr:hypothetical protein [Gaiellaceae bacterium]
MAVSGGKTFVYEAGAAVSFAVSAAVTEGKLVECSGNKTVATAAAESQKVVGVALQTASAVGDVIAVKIRGYIMKMRAEGAVAAGDELNAAADGSGDVTTLPVAATAVAEDINDARSVIGIALEAIADEAEGWVLVT